MGDVINLRRVRKALQKTQAATHADANRAKHGQTRAERTAAKTAAERLQRTLDGASLRDGEPRE